MAKRSKDDGGADQRHSGGNQDRRKRALTAHVPGRKGIRRYDPRYIDSNPLPTGTPVYTIKPAGLEEIERLARDGLDIVSIARGLGISPDTFVELRKRQPEAQEALLAGRAALGDEISNILLTKARNGETAAAIFLAKGRLGWREVGPTDPAAQAGPTINITIPPAMTPEQFMQMVDVTPKPKPDDDQGDTGGTAR